MDLKLFFDPLVAFDVVEPSLSCFKHSIDVHYEKMPPITGQDIALIGLDEYRGGGIEKNKMVSVDQVRKELYKLKKGYGDYRILDLGNLRNGPTLEETQKRIKEVCAYLLRKKVIPILFGGSHDLDMGQYFSYEGNNKKITLLSIDNQVDLDENALPFRNHLYKIITHTPNYLFNVIQLAYQSFLTEQRDIEVLERLSFDTLRLGIIKENIKEVEPVIREADMISFDMAALQSSYAPGAVGSNVYGLTGEEACQICWYAGQNEKLSSIGFYNYLANEDNSDLKNSFVMATMIWYFVEGFYHRKEEKNLMQNDYIKYDVHIQEHNPEIITFYKSKKSEKWWMEVPNLEKDGILNRTRMVACSYYDYQKAQQGEIPERWLNHLLKG